jgi:hypothetical protein
MVCLPFDLFRDRDTGSVVEPCRWIAHQFLSCLDHVFMAKLRRIICRRESSTELGHHAVSKAIPAAYL